MFEEITEKNWSNDTLHIKKESKKNMLLALILQHLFMI